jgi:membrane-associated phospholipid phosphatase
MQASGEVDMATVRSRPAVSASLRAASAAAGAGLLLLGGGLLGLDGLIARANVHAGLLGDGVALLDLLSGKTLTNFLLGPALVLVGLAGLAARRRRPWPIGLIYVGTAQFLGTILADVAKPPFGRPRPFQALVDGRWSDRWFAGPDFGSFPSGHVAFYAGLCVPLALLFPRWAAALLAVPLLVGAERILSNDHYPSDVGASLLLAAAVAGGLRFLIDRRALSPRASHPRLERA